VTRRNTFSPRHPLTLSPTHLFACALLTLSGCASQQQWTRTELLFGLSRPGGEDVTDAEFQAFLDQVVTPRFAQGYTVLSAQGRWREQTGVQRVEQARMVIIVHQHNAQGSREIDEIRNQYKSLFGQEAVLRVDDRQQVSF
jgi:hypothetical protein